MSDLAAALTEGLVVVDFVKANGELRTMVCTLKREILETHLPPRTTDAVKERPANLLVVFDYEAQAFRTIKTETIQKWKRKS